MYQCIRCDKLVYTSLVYTSALKVITGSDMRIDQYIEKASVVVFECTLVVLRLSLSPLSVHQQHESSVYLIGVYTGISIHFSCIQFSKCITAAAVQLFLSYRLFLFLSRNCKRFLIAVISVHLSRIHLKSVNFLFYSFSGVPLRQRCGFSSFTDVSYSSLGIINVFKLLSSKRGFPF